MASKVGHRVQILKLRPSATGFHTVEGYLAKIHNALRNFVERNRNGRPVKIQLKLRLDMIKYTPENKLIKSDPTFATSMLLVQNHKETSTVLKKLYHSLATNVEGYVQMGSGWTINRIIFLECQLVKCKKYVGGSRIPTTILPMEIRNKKGILNMTGVPKDWCFHYAVAACLLDLPWQRHPARACHYKKKGCGAGASLCTDGCWQYTKIWNNKWSMCRCVGLEQYQKKSEFTVQIAAKIRLHVQSFVISEPLLCGEKHQCTVPMWAKRH